MSDLQRSKTAAEKDPAAENEEANANDQEELSDEDLEKVAGGWAGPNDPLDPPPGS